MREFDRKIGEQIHRARTEAGLSQQQLAARVGSSQDAISHYELGARSVSLETLVTIARELNRPLGFFVETAPDLVVVKSSKLHELVSDVVQHDELDTLHTIWSFLKWNRSRAK